MDEMSKFIQLRELETSHQRNTGTYTLAWVIGIVIVVGIIAFIWNSNTHRHAELNREIGFMQGEIRSLAPLLVRIDGTLNNNNAGIVELRTHQNDFERFYFEEPNYGGNYGKGRGRGGCGRHEDEGHRRFNQLNTYTLDTQTVTVSDSCVA
jgi:hypothetical protein